MIYCGNGDQSMVVAEGELHATVTKFEGCLERYSTITEFKEYLTSESLSWEESRYGWVFWAPERDDEECKSGYGRSIREKIRRALIRVMCCCYSGDLVQFWAPKEEEGRSILTTSDQPFAISCFPEKGLSCHRKKCMEHHYTVDDRAEEEQLGPLGRVFRNGHHVSTPELRLCSTKEFPLRDHAASCGLKFYLALPIFDLHNQCVGVLEFVGLEHANLFHIGNLSDICKALQIVEMRTTHMIDMQQQINLWESVTHYGHVMYHQPQPSEAWEMPASPLTSRPQLQENICLLPLGYDEMFSTSEFREYLQMPEIDHTENVEVQEQNIVVTNCDEANQRVESKTSFHITYEDLEPHFGKRLEDAANELGVSRSTLKRARKECGMKRWPSNVKNKKNPSLFQMKTSNKPIQNYDQQIPQPSSSRLPISDFPVDSNVFHTCIESAQEFDKPCQMTDAVMIKAKYKKDMIKFELCLSSGIIKLMEEVAKRLKLIIGNFTLKYKDDDNDLILLTCDQDLHYYVKSMRSLGKTTVQVLVHLVSN